MRKMKQLPQFDDIIQCLYETSHGQLSIHAPITIDSQTLHTLYTAPSSDWLACLTHCVKSFIPTIYPMHHAINIIQMPSAMIGLALSIYNCLAIQNDFQDDTQGQSKHDTQTQSKEFTQALINTIPVADTVADALCYHAIICLALPHCRYFNAHQTDLLIQCIQRNPLSNLALIHMTLPHGLYDLAEELIPEWHQPDQTGPLITYDQWYTMVHALLNDTYINRWIIHQWLDLPTCVESCRNSGLVLESIRRKGEQTAFILDFYESCLYYHTYHKSSYDLFNILEICESLLTVPGANKATQQLNRKGQAYFLQFIPLLEMTHSHQSIPSRTPHIYSKMRAMGLRSQELYKYIPNASGHQIQFSPLAFEQEVKHV